MASPIGISFLPSAEQAAEGPRRGSIEGDLGQAIKLISLRLPRVTGARGIAPPALLQSPGAMGMAGGQPGGFNPHAAVFRALLAAMGQGGGDGVGAPRIIPGIGAPGRVPGEPPPEGMPGLPGPGTLPPGGADELRDRVGGVAPSAPSPFRSRLRDKYDYQTNRGGGGEY